MYQSHIPGRLGYFDQDPIYDFIGFTHHPPQCRIYASVNQVNTGSNNGLSPIWRQAIIQTNTGLLSIGPLEQTSLKF